VDEESGQWRSRLVAAGMLLPLGAPGLYGQGVDFERIVGAVARLVGSAGERPTTAVRFPPVTASADLLRTGYLGSFPTLTGWVHTFSGDAHRHEQLMRSVDAGEEWSGQLAPSGVAMCAAACHPLYGTITGPLPGGGARWDVYGTVFRNEPSSDPARMQAFRQYEHVYVGEPVGAVGHRDLWLERGSGLLAGLGLEVRSESANDPFFGRTGRMLATNQRLGGLKQEILAATGPGAEPTALCSVNYHVAHFGAAFGIHTAEGETAHSACVGFGVERVALALLWAHGMDPGRWPAAVARRLWP